MRKRRIKSMAYNIHQSSGPDGADAVLDFDYAEIGKALGDYTPKEIIECEPLNGLQRHFVDIHYTNGESKRVFNVGEINYYPIENELKN